MFSRGVSCLFNIWNGLSTCNRMAMPMKAVPTTPTSATHRNYFYRTWKQKSCLSMLQIWQNRLEKGMAAPYRCEASEREGRIRRSLMPSSIRGRGCGASHGHGGHQRRGGHRSCGLQTRDGTNNVYSCQGWRMHVPSVQGLMMESELSSDVMAGRA